MPLQRQVDHGIKQRMSRAYERRQRLPLGCDQRFLESDALVAWQHRLADTDQSGPGFEPARERG